jgi:hypothetical protein
MLKIRTVVVAAILYAIYNGWLAREYEQLADVSPLFVIPLCFLAAHLLLWRVGRDRYAPPGAQPAPGAVVESAAPAVEGAAPPLPDTPYHRAMARTHTEIGYNFVFSLGTFRDARGDELSVEEFIARQDAWRPDIEAAHSVRPFGDDEFIVDVFEHAFVVTSSAFYVLGENPRCVLISDVGKPAYKTRWGKVEVQLQMGGGRTFDYVKSLDTPRYHLVERTLEAVREGVLEAIRTKTAERRAARAVS